MNFLKNYIEKYLKNFYRSKYKNTRETIKVPHRQEFSLTSRPFLSRSSAQSPQL